MPAAVEPWRSWAPTYDPSANPLLSLETRALHPLLDVIPFSTMLDVGAGTGRWMSYALRRGARAFGMDICLEMLLRAAEAPGLRSRLVLGDACRLPFRDRGVDLALCSFALSYFDFPVLAFREMARVAARLIVADMHPSAIARGWKRSFAVDGRTRHIGYRPWRENDLERWARAAGLQPEWRVEQGFEEQDRPVFEREGKPELFAEARSVPAVLIRCWRIL